MSEGTQGAIVIIGAGPAGLTAGYELAKAGRKVVVLEASGIVGGIAQTASYKGFRFDIGGHRFFTKNKEVEAFWHEIMGPEFIKVRRMSRIYYDGKFFDYPLKPMNAFLNLGPIETSLCVMSYFWARLFPIKPEKSLEDWVTNRFGRRLFRIFFKTYTEKVWGMPCDQISADWAAQRIKGLSLRGAILSAFKLQRGVIKTLIDAFEYPRLGPGQMWETATAKIRAMGGEVLLHHPVVRIEHRVGAVTAVVAKDAAGQEKRFAPAQVISTMPLRQLVERMDPPASSAALEAARSLKYRDFLTVVLVVDKRDLFPDNWIYIHDPSVKVGRIQNFRNWSADMIPNDRQTALGLEYFCNAGDDLWNMPDADLVALGKKEIAKLGLAKTEDLVDGTVVRMPKAYPVYDDRYLAHVRAIREWLSTLANLQSVGRNGMHKYNNQDHSMYAAMLAARRILGTTALDPWNVNTDAEYSEEIREGEQSGRMVPSKI